VRRVILVSNRLPVAVSRRDGVLSVDRSSGGLATGLGRVHNQGDSVWIGWSGYSDALDAAEQSALDRQFEELRVVSVPLSHDEVERYYEEFCNGVLWPLFHYLIGQLPPDVHGFELYESINRRFADAVVAQYRPGDVIWIHDYQLMLVPQMVREQLPGARIGFFLHIPFPASDVFRTLPFRDRLLQGLLGADLVGFHTAEYMRHFASAALRILGVGTDVDCLRWDQRSVRLGVFPMGVDAQHFAELAESPGVKEQVRVLRNGGQTQLLVGIDRLDYTKGIPRRLIAYERLLLEHPELREKVRLIQVAVPSRTNVDAYQTFREQVDTMIGRIHGAFATPNWVPIHYIFRGLPEDEVVALYCAADVMLVTPVRDGMNLVAKEFVASRNDDGGVLVLSEFAGAAHELAEAVHVNPFDSVGMAESFARALDMPTDERATRMQALRRRVFGFNVHRWAELFLSRLDQDTEEATASARVLGESSIRELAKQMAAAQQLILLVDYDGTLVPIASTPELARPDAAVMTLLAKVAARPGTEVHVVSGRPRDTLERWLGRLPIYLHAEHGSWSRAPGQPGVALEESLPAPWREKVRSILREYADRTPGTLVEEKPTGLAWHYRMADPEFGPLQANELRVHLTELLSNTPVQILSGRKVIELRQHGVHKGLVVAPILARHPEALMVAMGDDTTDDDLFASLPPNAISIHVGPAEFRSTLRMRSPSDVRLLLSLIAEVPPPVPPLKTPVAAVVAT
jgi:trehalose 6-phosphate synthase/phosphatase